MIGDRLVEALEVQRVRLVGHRLVDHVHAHVARPHVGDHRRRVECAVGVDEFVVIALRRVDREIDGDRADDRAGGQRDRARQGRTGGESRRGAVYRISTQH